MDQRRGLKGIALGLIFHVAAGHEPQFRIDVLREPGQGGFVTAAPGFQEVRDFRRACFDGSAVPPGHLNIKQLFLRAGRFCGSTADCTGGGEQKLINLLPESRMHK